MATLNYLLIDNKSRQLIFSRLQETLLKRPRLSIAPCRKAWGLWVIRLGADSPSWHFVPRTRQRRGTKCRSLIL